MNGCDYVVVVVDNVAVLGGDDGGGGDVDDDVDDDLMMRNHFLNMVHHRKMNLVEARMDRMVLLKPLIMVDHCDIVNSTYHGAHHPI